MRRISVLAALALVVGACSDDGGGTVRDSIDNRDVDDRRGQAEVVVEVSDNRFTPQNVRIDPGTTIVFENRGSNIHDIRAFDEDGFGADFGLTQLRVDDRYEFTFDAPGTYRYWCKLHGTKDLGMIGAIVVGDGDLGAAPTTTTGATAPEGTLRVPQDYPTIQAAVDAAAPGSLILVDKGVYKEAVTVEPGHENIVIRGVDRNETVLDGEFDENLPNAFKVLADGVAIENMTARNYTTNAFFWTGVDGYRGSYLTSWRTGDYGIYAFDSVNGEFDHDYASGAPDAGFYIGQCYPCNAVIRDSVAEWNGLGYSGTNAGGNLLIVNSVFRYNRGGIVPNSGDGEANPPERETTIVGNLVHDNDNGLSPAIEIAEVAQGFGIINAGGRDNVVERNLVIGHRYGIVMAIQPESPQYLAIGNEVRDNVVEESSYVDLGLIAAPDQDNCFEGNTYKTSLPEHIDEVLACGVEPPDTLAGTDVLAGEILSTVDRNPPGADYRDAAPEPPPQENMPDALTAPPVPATSDNVPSDIDLDAITVPDPPATRDPVDPNLQ
jgi:plastocyanin